MRERVAATFAWSLPWAEQQATDAAIWAVSEVLKVSIMTLPTLTVPISLPESVYSYSMYVSSPIWLHHSYFLVAMHPNPRFFIFHPLFSE